MTAKLAIIAAGVAAAVCATAALGWRATAAEAVYPVENARVRVSRGVFARVRAVFSRASLAAENRRLKAERDALLMTHGDLTRARAEIARLRGLLDLKPAADATHRWICAPVLSLNGAAGVSGYLRLGKGSLAGVTEGAAVAVPDGLVGRVENVSPHTCDVRLITDPSVKVSCRLETDDGAPAYGILSGNGAVRVAEAAGASLVYAVNPLTARHIGRDAGLPPRARVTTSGLGGVFPPGIPVGVLADGGHESADRLEREGLVVPAVDFRSLEDVFIRRED